MLLGGRLLQDVASVNQYRYSDQYRMTYQDPTTVYFQVVDRSLDTVGEGYRPPGRRYVPASGAVLQVTVDSIDSGIRILNRTATQAFPTQDPSIYSVSLLASDTVSGTCNLLLTLTEGTVVRHGRVLNALAISPQRGGY